MRATHSTLGTTLHSNRARAKHNHQPSVLIVPLDIQLFSTLSLFMPPQVYRATLVHRAHSHTLPQTTTQTRRQINLWPCKNHVIIIKGWGTEVENSRHAPFLSLCPFMCDSLCIVDIHCASKLRPNLAERHSCYFRGVWPSSPFDTWSRHCWQKDLNSIISDIVIVNSVPLLLLHRPGRLVYSL